MSQMAAQPESLRYRQLLKVLNKALDASVDADQTLPVIHGCFRGLPKSGKARFDLLCRSMLRELRKNIEVGCVCVCVRVVCAHDIAFGGQSTLASRLSSHFFLLLLSPRTERVPRD